MLVCIIYLYLFLFFNDSVTTEIYTLSLHDALPIARSSGRTPPRGSSGIMHTWVAPALNWRSEEHTSELQSRLHLVCRLLLEKKKQTTTTSAFSESRSRSERQE